MELTWSWPRKRRRPWTKTASTSASKAHQENTYAGAEQRFKGGLADDSEQTTKLHRYPPVARGEKGWAPEVAQQGSNITPERLRFDFSFGRKMTKEEKQEVERLVNEYIKGAAPITCEEMTVAEAKAQGAIGLFESKYGERVKVYTMGEYSKEICGGPPRQQYRRPRILPHQKGGGLLRRRAQDQGHDRGLKTKYNRMRMSLSSGGDILMRFSL